MSCWIILPFDNSPVARATLHRAANAVRESGASYRGVTLATAGVDPADLDELALQACVVAGPGVPLDVVLLNPGDPIGALSQLVDSMPDAVLATPLGMSGDTPWYRAACKAEGIPCALLLFFLKPAEVRRFTTAGERPSHRSALRRCLSGVRAWLRPEARPPRAGQVVEASRAPEHAAESPRSVSGDPLPR